MAASKYITLISSDALEFVILREAALVSPTIKAMLRSPFIEAQTGRCKFPEIRYVFCLYSRPSSPHHHPSTMMTHAVSATDRSPGRWHPSSSKESPDCMSVIYT